MRMTRNHSKSILTASAIVATLFLWLALLPSSLMDSTMDSTRTAKATEPKVMPPPPVRLGGARTAKRAALSAVTPLAAIVSATKSDSLLIDVNNDGNADPGDTLEYTVTITNTGDMAATGLAFTDTIDANTTLVPGSVNASPLAADDSYTAIGNVSIAPNAAQGLLANDFDPDGGSVVVSSSNTAGVQGNITVNADGSFTFNPNPGFEGTTSFTYTITDTGGQTSTATATITVSGMIWFANAAAPAGGDGRLSSPFNALTGGGSFAAVAADDPGDNIFVYSGAYAGGLTLLANQRFIGQGAAASLATITGLTPPAYSATLPATGGARPTISASTNNLTIATGNTVRGVTLSNTGATALIGSNFGNLSVADTVVTNTGGVAVSLASGNPTASFISVSSSGAANGIVLSNTTGSFSVTGTGSAGSGGTIASTVGADGTGAGIGVSLTNATNVSLAFMQINGHPNFAIRGTDVNGFALNNTVISGANGSSIAFDEGSVMFTNLLGAVSITGSTISGGHEDNMKIVNSGGALNMTVTGSTFEDNHTVFGGSSLHVQMFASAIASINITASTFDDNLGDAILATFSGSSSTTLAVSGSSFSDNFSGIDLVADQNADVDLTVSSNSFLNHTGGVILVGSASATLAGSHFDGVVSGNTIGNPATADSGSMTDKGIAADFRGNGTGAFSVTNNVISHTDIDGINIDSRLGSGSVGLTVTGNTVNTPDDNSPFPFVDVNGIRIQSRNARTTCLNISGNTSSHRGAGDDYSLRQANTAVFRLQGFAGVGTSAAAVETFIESQNTGTCTVQLPTVNYTNGTCAVPTPVMEEFAEAQSRARRSAETVEGFVPSEDILPVGNGERFVDAAFPRLSDFELNAIVQAAVSRLLAAGVSPTEGARLASVRFQIADLEDDLLATASLDGVYMDSNAAGHGWFVDQTPEDDLEFPVSVGEGGLRAKQAKAISRQVDLLTVVTRELLFVLGQQERWQVYARQGLMGMRLNAGLRYLPDAGYLNITIPPPPTVVEGKGGTDGQVISAATGAAGDAADASSNQTLPDTRQALYRSSGPENSRSTAKAIWRSGEAERSLVRVKSAASAPAMAAGETVTLNIAQLPAGKSVTIKFKVTINSPLSDSVCQVANQGAITGDGGINVVTDDPDTAAAGDATATPIVRPPTITCSANITETENPPASGSATVNYLPPTVTPSCGVTVNCTPASGSSFPIGVTTVSCTATNAANQTATCTFTVTVNAACQITCPGNIAVANDPDQCGAVVTFPAPTTLGNCGAVTCVPASGTFFPVGATAVVCSTETGPSCTFTVTVNDTQAPSVTCPANITQPTGVGCAVVNFSPTVNDNCPNSTVVCTPPSGTCFAPGTTTVNCTATDAAGLTATCSFTVTVVECAVTCPANVTVNNDPNQCGAVVNYPAPTTTGGCGTVTCTPASGTSFPIGTTTVNCSTTAGPSCSFTVTVNDNQPPAITCPANITTGTDQGVSSAVVNFAPTVTDNCGGVSFTCTPPSGTQFPLGTTTVNCTATDAAGAQSSCSFTVTVADNQNPVITCPAGVTVANQPTQCGAVVNYPMPTVTDNSPGVSFTCSPASGAFFPVGTTIVTCTALDVGGNTASCSFSVTVNDTQAPVINCPANISVPADAGVCSAVVTLGTPTAADNCPGVTVVGVRSDGLALNVPYPVGTTTITWTARDAAIPANQTSCVQTITVVDTQAPTITLTGTQIQLWPPNHQYVTVNLSQLVSSASDNCGGNLTANVVISKVTSDEPDNGLGDGDTPNDIVIAANCKSVQLRAERQGGGNGRVYTLTFRVVDAAGNVTTKTAKVTVPKSQGNNGAAVDDGPNHTVNGNCP